MSECTVLTLNEKIGNEEFHLVDVREYAEFAGGRVEGAKLLPLGELEKTSFRTRSCQADLCDVPNGKAFGRSAKKIEIARIYERH